MFHFSNLILIKKRNYTILNKNFSILFFLKSSEPLFVLLICHYILEEKHTARVNMTLIPICLGVILIVYDNFTLNLTGILSAFAANIASSLRIVFYKTKLKDSSSLSISSSKLLQISPYTTYLNVGFVSFCLYAPAYLFKSLIMNFSISSYSWTNNEISSQTVVLYEYLIVGASFTFICNLFMLLVLANVSPVSLSIINILKRVFIVFSSMIVFSTRVTFVQWMGMVLVNLGAYAYSVLKAKANKVGKGSMIGGDGSGGGKRSGIGKSILVGLVGAIVLGSCFIGQVRDRKMTMRIKCIEGIKLEIKESLRALIPKDKNVHFFNLPETRNFDETLQW